MLSVDSGGNFRYFSGPGQKTLRGFENLSREAMASNASIVTDKFTSFTAEKLSAARTTQSASSTQARKLGAVAGQPLPLPAELSIAASTPDISIIPTTLMKHNVTGGRFNKH